MVSACWGSACTISGGGQGMYGKETDRIVVLSPAILQSASDGSRAPDVVGQEARHLICEMGIDADVAVRSERVCIPRIGPMVQHRHGARCWRSRCNIHDSRRQIGRHMVQVLALDHLRGDGRVSVTRPLQPHHMPWRPALLSRQRGQQFAAIREARRDSRRSPAAPPCVLPTVRQMHGEIDDAGHGIGLTECCPRAGRSPDDVFESKP